MDDSEEKFAVYYAKGAQWYKLQPTEYIECVTDNYQNNYIFYPETYNRKPGYGIWNSYFSKNADGVVNKELVTSYIIFNSAVDCDKVLIVDQSGNESLTLTELGVFDADPLQHLAYEKTDAINGEKEISWNSDEITGANVSGSNLENVMINGSPASTDGYTLTGGSGYIYIQTKTEAPLQHLLSWYSEDGSTMKLQNNVSAYAGDLSIQDNEYFVPLVNLGQDETWSGVSDVVDTPFYGLVKRSLGNPLPYAPDGIDSPRTFAYKMVQQKDARDNLKKADPSTMATDNSYEQGYARKEDFSSLGTNKPFLPGYYLPYGNTAYNANFKPEMSAGVDNLGLLQGAMSMLDGVEFLNLDESNLETDINAYYEMNSEAPGLDSDNKPLFDASNAQSYDNILKMSMADIERGSIIVPDISDIRAGDLLVCNNEDGHHLGVVVGFRDTKPSTATAAPDWWENVLVVSVRPGFQSVTLGTWGNVNGIFGGFTENPEQYMIRRLVKHTDTPMTVEVTECINSIYHQYLYDYPENEAYWNGNTAWPTTDKEKYQIFVKKEGATFMELPPSSFRTNILNSPMFKYDNVVDENIAVSSYSGWRDINLGNDRITYHRGVDLVPVDNSSPGAGDLNAETTVEILAPESGKYWTLDLKYDPLNNAKPLFIKIDDENVLILEDYSPIDYGDLGILVTNPGNPQKGRIYVFAHLYYDGSSVLDENDEKSNKTTKSVTGCAAYYNSNDTLHFKDINGNEIDKLPTSCDTAGYVKAGDWIGLTAANSETPITPHNHMEVYEYFSNFSTEKDLSKIIDDLYTQLGVLFNENVVMDFSRWQRVNGRFIFNKNILVDRESAPAPQTLLTFLEGNSEDWWNEEGVDKITFLNAMFKDWEYWVLPEED